MTAQNNAVAINPDINKTLQTKTELNKNTADTTPTLQDEPWWFGAVLYLPLGWESSVLIGKSGKPLA